MAGQETTGWQQTGEEISTERAGNGTGPARASSSRSELPVACSLTSAGLAAQMSRWERLAAWAMAERTETQHGLRIEFRPEPGAEEDLRALAAVEAQCCPWAAWTVEASAGRIVLDVRSAGEGIAALHGMFTSLRPAPLPPA